MVGFFVKNEIFIQIFFHFLVNIKSSYLLRFNDVIISLIVELNCYMRKKIQFI
jgi:hypothetical protein